MAISKVLLVDDDPSIRQIGNLSLRNIGKWQVLVAASGEEAVALVLREAPDVVLLDYMMPGLDGPATLRHIREHASAEQLPVIFLTAKNDQAELAEMLALGAKGVIIKPFAPLLLPGQIRQLIEPAGSR